MVPQLIDFQLYLEAYGIRISEPMLRLIGYGLALFAVQIFLEWTGLVEAQKPKRERMSPEERQHRRKVRMQERRERSAAIAETESFLAMRKVGMDADEALSRSQEVYRAVRAGRGRSDVRLTGFNAERRR